MSLPEATLVYVRLPYATFGILVDQNGWVVFAPPLARWMIGKHWREVVNWLHHKHAKWERLEEQP